MPGNLLHYLPTSSRIYCPVGTTAALHGTARAVEALCRPHDTYRTCFPSTGPTAMHSIALHSTMQKCIERDIFF